MAENKRKATTSQRYAAPSEGALKRGERIRTMLEHFPSRDFAAQVAGISPGQLRAYMRGEAPNFEAIARLCAYSGFGMDWIASGLGEPRPNAGAGGAGGEAAVIRPPRGRAVLPSGRTVSAAQLVDDLHFRAAFLRLVFGGGDGEPACPLLVRVEGDAMRPTLAPGDLCLVDAGGSRVPTTGLYALLMGESIEIRRLDPRPDGLRVIPDNRNYEPAVFKEAGSGRDELNILGRVVWVGSGV